MIRRLAVVALLVSACSPPVTTEPIPTTAPSTTTSTAAATTTVPGTSSTDAATSDPSTATSTVPLDADFYRLTEEYREGLEVDVHAPEAPGPWPVAVLVHGGGWFAGDRASMSLLADGLAERGVVAYNVGYRTVAMGGGFPGTVDDIACAVAHARASADRFTDTPEQVAVVGHSAGAHLGALVAFAPGEFGAECGARGADALVGLAGPYDTDRLSFLLAPFFGTRFDEDPEPWLRGNPFTYLDTAPAVPTLLLHGDADDVVTPAFSEQLALAMEEAGLPVTLEVVLGADHGTVNDPRVVADTIAEFLTSS